MTYLEILSKILNQGHRASPRGQEIIEIENFNTYIDLNDPCMSYAARNFNLQYIKEEFKWKLTGDRFNHDILKHAKMWSNLIDDDGGINSQYGHFWFGSQKGMQFVIDELSKDMDSRRASIPMLNTSHMRLDIKDMVCTYAIGFRIRNGQLNMSVHMRSNDFFFGLTTDAVTFALLYRMIYARMVEVYPELMVGSYYHCTDSMHVYERHYAMMAAMLREGEAAKYDCPIPWPTASDVDEILIWGPGAAQSEFVDWLYS